MEEVTKASHKLAEEVYKAAGAKQAGGARLQVMPARPGRKPIIVRMVPAAMIMGRRKKAARMM